jgi:hypothetical protein
VSPLCTPLSSMIYILHNSNHLLSFKTLSSGAKMLLLLLKWSIYGKQVSKRSEIIKQIKKSLFLHKMWQLYNEIFHSQCDFIGYDTMMQSERWVTMFHRNILPPFSGYLPTKPQHESSHLWKPQILYIFITFTNINVLKTLNTKSELSNSDNFITCIHTNT